MRVLLVGSGGREHALAWKLAQSPLCERLVVAPGNPGIAGEPKVTCVPIAADAIGELTAAAVAERADLVVCGPEAPLVRRASATPMRAAGLSFFGPSRAAAEIEGSKAFAKQLMARRGRADRGVRRVRRRRRRRGVHRRAARATVVVKADGLAAGKGVVVAGDKAEAKAAVRRDAGRAARSATPARAS